MKLKKCPNCDNGFVMELDGDGYGSEVICSICNGTGKIDEDNLQDPDPDKERT